MEKLRLPAGHEARRRLDRLAKKAGLCAPRKVDKPLVLYGAGNLGEMAKDYFRRLQIPFLYVVDSNPGTQRGKSAWNGIPVLRPADVPLADRGACLLAICVANASFSGIASSLLKQGWRDIVSFYDITEAYTDRCPLGNGWFSGPLNDGDIGNIGYVLDNWADDVSRAHHLQFIAWHRSREELLFADAPVTTDDRFFIPEIVSALRKDEIFLDGGAHHGEVSQRFKDVVGGKFRKIYMVEPDKQSIAVLRKKMASSGVQQRQNTEIFDFALGSLSGPKPFFYGLGYASQFCAAAKGSVQVRTLDELDIPVTFIKLHLEGWEYDAFLGAKQTLKRCRPLLAVTAYHNRNGLWKLPSLLMKSLKDYMFIFRLHSWLGTGAVLYAVPRERLAR